MYHQKKESNIDKARYLPNTFLLYYLVKREIVGKFRRHILGVSWIILGPLFTSTIMVCAFYGIFGIGSGSIFDYSMYVLSGVVLIQFITGSLVSIASSLINSRALISKIHIPIFSFPLSTLLTQVINFSIGLSYLIVISFFSKRIYFNVTSFVVTILSLSIFIFGLGLLFAVFISKIPDFITLLPIILQALTYITPIFYQESIWPSNVRSFLILNPFLYFTRAFRSSFGTVPISEVNFTFLVLGSIAVLMVGILVFKHSWKNIAKRL